MFSNNLVLILRSQKIDFMDDDGQVMDLQITEGK